MIEITKSNWTEKITENKKLIIADYYAPWCGKCRMLMPAIEKIEDKYPECEFVKINVEDETLNFVPEDIELSEVRSLPHIKFIYNNKELRTMVSDITPNKIDIAISEIQNMI